MLGQPQRIPGPTLLLEVAYVVADERRVDLGTSQAALPQSPPRIGVVVGVAVPEFVRLGRRSLQDGTDDVLVRNGPRGGVQRLQPVRVRKTLQQVAQLFD